MQKRWNFILYCKLIWENHWLRCTSPPASDLCAWDHTLSLMFRGWINFSKHLALLALQLDAAAILANLLFTSCETKKLNLSFNFLSSAYKSLPMFLKTGDAPLSFGLHLWGFCTDLRCPGCLSTKALFNEPVSGRSREEESSNLSSWKFSADHVDPAWSISFSANINLFF